MCAALTSAVIAVPNSGSAIESSDALTGGFVLERLAGANRFGTSALASKAAFPGGSTDVVVARADDFPDALAGNYLAGQLGAPILLSDGDGLSAGVLAEIERLGATRAHVLGGPGALGPGVITGLQAAGLSVERVFGADRHQTAAAIATTSPAVQVGVDQQGRRTAIIGSGAGFADLLAAGSLSYAAKFPILVTSAASLPPSVPGTLEDLGVAHVLLLGGPAAVSSAVEQELVDLGVVVTRLGGANRYETAVAVGRYGLDHGHVVDDHVNVATGTAFPDALAIGPLGGAQTAMTVLVGTQPIPALCSLLAELPLVSGHLAGGTNAVSDTTKALIEACATGTTPVGGGGTGSGGGGSGGGGSGGGGGAGGGGGSTPPSGGGDMTPPVLESFLLSPTQVDTSADDQTITMTARITDDLAGVNDFQALEMGFQSPSGAQSVSTLFSASNRVSGDEFDGVYEATVVVPAFSEPGVWTVSFVFLRDAANNSVTLTAEELLAETGMQITFLVLGSGGGDMTPPVLESFLLSPTQVDTSADDQTITMTARITDDLAGVNDFQALEMGFQSPSGAQSVSTLFSASNRVSGDEFDGVYEATVVVPAFWEPGVWTVSFVFLRDAANNSVTLPLRNSGPKQECRSRSWSSERLFRRLSSR